MIIYNNEFLPKESPLFNIENRGFKYGDGFFESMRMFHGEIIWAEAHTERLQETLEALMFDDIKQFDAFFLKSKTVQLANKNRLGPNARFRLNLFRSGEGLYTPENNQVSYILSGESLPDSKYTLNKRGIILNVFPTYAKAQHPLSKFKTSNALVSVLAANYRKQQGWDDAVILNQEGFICETTNSNIFIKYQGVIYTPPIQDGCVNGIMRSKILEIAAEENIPIFENQLHPKILEVAEEVFVTNAVKGVQWVMGYGSKRYFRESTQFFSEALNKRIITL